VNKKSNNSDFIQVNSWRRGKSNWQHGDFVEELFWRFQRFQQKFKGLSHKIKKEAAASTLSRLVRCTRSLLASKRGWKQRWIYICASGGCLGSAAEGVEPRGVVQGTVSWPGLIGLSWWLIRPGPDTLPLTTPPAPPPLQLSLNTPRCHNIHTFLFFLNGFVEKEEICSTCEDKNPDISMTTRQVIRWRTTIGNR